MSDDVEVTAADREAARAALSRHFGAITASSSSAVEAIARAIASARIAGALAALEDMYHYKIAPRLVAEGCSCHEDPSSAIACFACQVEDCLKDAVAARRGGK